jgi:hypothetical protein
MANLNPGDIREQRVARYGDAVHTTHVINETERAARANSVRHGRVPGVTALPQGEIPQGDFDPTLKSHL